MRHPQKPRNVRGSALLVAAALSVVSVFGWAANAIAQDELSTNQELIDELQKLQDRIVHLQAVLKQDHKGATAAATKERTQDASADGSAGVRIAPRYRECLQCHQTRPSGPLPASHLVASGTQPAAPGKRMGMMGKGMGMMGDSRMGMMRGEHMGGGQGMGMMSGMGGGSGMEKMQGMAGGCGGMSGMKDSQAGAEGMAGKGYVGAMGRSGASGEGYGTAGIAPSALGAGVAGYATFTGSSPTTLVDAGVTGGTRRTTGAAVAGVASGSSGGASGVFGESWASAGGYGVYGKANLGSNYAVFSEGNLLVGGGGTKMFAHPHPTDASKEIHFVCLEGDESGTYFRGSAVLAGGRAVIAVPEAFRLVTEAEGLTVQLTAMGRGELWVESKGLERIVVRGTADLAFDYFVNGVRAGYADFQPIQENRVYRPRVAGAPYGAGFHPAARAALVRNGTLNADGTPNTATARRLGWNLMENGTPVYSTTGVQLSGPQPTTASLPPRAADPSTSARRRTEDR